MQQNLFGTSDLASGYATARPPVHPEILRRFRQQRQAPIYARALDVGCGAGLSTRALTPYAKHAIGIEPAESMLHQARKAGITASLVTARGEGLPFGDHTIDFMTAAGSLNYTDGLQEFFREARRVFTPRNGGMLVYDFSQGRNAALEPWFETFMTRYPKAKDNARPLDPIAIQSQAVGTFNLVWHEYFQIPLSLDHEAYVNYMMTETNVAYAVSQGLATASEIRDWCRQTLRPTFERDPQQQVLFNGYMALLQ